MQGSIGFPDWGKETELASSAANGKSTWTAVRNGWLLLLADGYNHEAKNSRENISLCMLLDINGAFADHAHLDAQPASQRAKTFGAKLYPLRKGDAVSVNLIYGGYTAYFVPARKS